jgi:hypothetical protein
MNKIKALCMKRPPILLIVAVLVLCLLAAGCTSPTQAEIKPVSTPEETPPPTLSTSVATVVATPLAVETLPPEQFVDLELSKERPDSTIHLLYNGGKGEIFVQNVMMRVTRSDGQVIEQYMNDGKRKPRRGDELIIQGTRGSDRAEVFVTSAGRTYKITDKSLEVIRY